MNPRQSGLKDIAQQTSDVERNSRNALASEMSFHDKEDFVKRISFRSNQDLRDIQPDPNDIDIGEYGVKSNLNARNIKPDPYDIDDEAVERNEKVYNHQRDNEGREELIQYYSHRNEEPVKESYNPIDIRVGYEQNFTPQLGGHEDLKEDASDMYDNLSEFEKKFMRESAGVNNHSPY